MHIMRLCIGIVLLGIALVSLVGCSTTSGPKTESGDLGTVSILNNVITYAPSSAMANKLSIGDVYATFTKVNPGDSTISGKQYFQKSDLELNKWVFTLNNGTSYYLLTANYKGTYDITVFVEEETSTGTKTHQLQVFRASIDVAVNNPNGPPPAPF